MATSKADILLLQETRVDSTSTLLKAACFTLFRTFVAHSTDQPNRGILIAISTELPVVRVEVVAQYRGSLLIVRCICTGGLRNLLVVNFHGDSRNDDEMLFSWISDELSSFADHLTFIGGDFNCQISPSSISILKSGNWLPSNESGTLCNLMRHTSTMTGGYRTDPHSRFDWTGHCASSVLDMILISDYVPRSSIHMETMVTFVGSDHVPILAVLQLSQPCCKQIRYLRTKLSRDCIKQHGKQISLAMLHDDHDKDLSVQQLYLSITESMARGVSLGLGRRLDDSPRPIPRHYHQTRGWPRHMINKVNKIKSKISRIQIRMAKSTTPSLADKLSYSSLTVQFHGLRKTANKAARDSLEETLNQTSYSNVSGFFRFLDRYRTIPKFQGTNSPLRIIDSRGQLTHGPEAAKLLAAALSMNVTISAQAHCALMQSTMLTLIAQPASPLQLNHLQDPITMEELDNAIKLLPYHKSPGQDNITNELIQISPYQMRQDILLLFNKVIETGDIPSEWRCSITVPVPKKGDPYRTENWRGISLLSSLYKLFARILADRLVTFLDTHAPLHWTQFGFRKGCSTMEPIFCLWEVCDRRRLKFLHSYICFADFKMAFDQVHPLALHAALHIHRIPPAMTTLLCNLYAEQSASLRTPNDLEEPATYRPTCGVRQGCCLAPLLFSIVIDTLAHHLEYMSRLNTNLGVFIPDLPPNSARLHFLLYADDLVIIGHDQQSLQLSINHCVEWSRLWGFTLSTTKTKSMWIQHPKSTRSPPQFQIANSPIELVSVFTYLGIPFNNQLCWTQLVASRKAAFCKSYFALTSLWRTNLWSIKARVQAYISLVQSTGIYGCALWLTTLVSFQPFQTVIVHHLRHILSLPKQPSLSIACLEVGITHPFETLKLIQLQWLFKTRMGSSLWAHILHSTSSSNKSALGKVLRSLKTVGYNSISDMTTDAPLKTFMETQICKESSKAQRVGFYIRYLNGRRYCSPEYKPLYRLATPHAHFSRSLLLQLRLGCWFTSADFIRIYHKKHQLPLPTSLDCLFCGNSKETAEHLLLECHNWRLIRETHLPEIVRHISPEPLWDSLPNQDKLAMLLGGHAYNTTFTITSESSLFTLLQEYVEAIFESRNSHLTRINYNF